MAIMITGRSISTLIFINYPQPRSLSEVAQYMHTGLFYSYYCIRSQGQLLNPTFGDETHLRINKCTFSNLGKAFNNNISIYVHKCSQLKKNIKTTS